MGELRRKERIESKEAELNIESMGQFLQEEYVDKRKTTREISQIVFGKSTSASTITHWLRHYNIPIRQGGEAIKAQWENNPERKAQQTEIANKYLAKGEGREKLIAIMQTEEYRLKLSNSKMGEQNGMYGAIRELSPRWNPLKTDEERELMRSRIEDTQWRNEVFQRDDYTCQCCGDDRGGNLHAHHLDGWNWCKDRRLDVSNGITLCSECHTSFHKQYRYGDNTTEQYEEWFDNYIA